MIGRNTEQYWLHLQFSEPIVRYKINEIKAGAVPPEIDMNQYSLFFDLMLISVLAGGGGGGEEKEVFLKRSTLTPSFLLLPSPPRQAYL